MEYYDIENWSVFWTIAVIFAVVGIVVTFFFLLNLRDLLRQVSAQNRSMQPNQVWLNFIPFFGLVWMIITVIKVRDSVRAEFASRGWTAQGDFGYGVGLAFAIMSFFAGVLVVIPMLVCFVIYWMKTSELKNQLLRAQPPAGWAPLQAPPPAPMPTSVARIEDEAEAEVDTDAEPAEAEVICPVCGVANRQNAKFCRSCGRSF